MSSGTGVPNKVVAECMLLTLLDCTVVDAMFSLCIFFGCFLFLSTILLFFISFIKLFFFYFISTFSHFISRTLSKVSKVLRKNLNISNTQSLNGVEAIDGLFMLYQMAKCLIVGVSFAQVSSVMKN